LLREIGPEFTDFVDASILRQKIEDTQKKEIRGRQAGYRVIAGACENNL
jgi:hypothetical protein